MTKRNKDIVIDKSRSLSDIGSALQYCGWITEKFKDYDLDAIKSMKLDVVLHSVSVVEKELVMLARRLTEGKTNSK